MDTKYHYVYKITNNINGHFYYGVHNTNNLEDGYIGSGIKLHEAYNKYGHNNFTKEIIKFFDTKKEAFDYEKEIVTPELIKNPNCYNIQPGGEYVQKEGFVIVRDPNDPENKLFTVSVDDERYTSGELVYMFKNKALVKNSENDTIWVDKGNIPDGYKGIQAGKVVVKDKDNNTYCVNVFDERYLNGELVPIAKNTVVVKDNSGNYMRVEKTDERYTSGQFQFMFKNTKIVKDKDGNHFRISCNDDRLKIGEVTGILKGKTLAKDKDGNKIWIDANDIRLKTGELVGHTKGRKMKLSTIRKRVDKVKGRIFINNGVVNKFLPKEEAEIYLNSKTETWILGMVYKPRKHGKNN